jgi:regulatory protein
LEEDKMDFEYLTKIDKLKTKVLKYIMYKKRTEHEVREKFKDEENDILDDVIDNLKELGYINDNDYIKRSVNEFLNLKNMSIKELTYKLASKGIHRNDIENYIYANNEELKDYEKRSAINIYKKKKSSMEYEDIVSYLYRKGYSQESIKYLGDESSE